MAKITEDDFFESAKLKLTGNSIAQGPMGCVIWQGGGDGRYGEVKLLSPGNPPRRIVYRVHRLAMMIKLHQITLTGGVVSHRCHNKYCVNVEHLNIEPQYINNQRECCRSNIVNGRRKCRGHDTFPECIF